MIGEETNQAITAGQARDGRDLQPSHREVAPHQFLADGHERGPYLSGLQVQAERADDLWLSRGIVYAGIVLYDRREGDYSFDLKSLDPPPDVLSFNQLYIGIDADLADFEDDESSVKECIRVRFT